MQRKSMSAIESVSNIVIGYWLAVLCQLAVFPVFGVSIPISDNLAIGGVFTVVSFCRSYFIRRLFIFIGRG